MNLNSQRLRRGPVWKTALAGLVLLAWALAPKAAAQEQDKPSDYQVKAAFLFNFGKFVEWPASAFTNARSPLVIGVLGGDPSHGDLGRVIADRQIGLRRVEVREIQSPSDWPGCQMLFMTSALSLSQVREALKDLNGASVLTVGEADGFCEAGGMINFVIENRQVHFEINNGAALAANLKISSKLVILARRLVRTLPASD